MHECEHKLLKICEHFTIYLTKMRSKPVQVIITVKFGRLVKYSTLSEDSLKASGVSFSAHCFLHRDVAFHPVYGKYQSVAV